MNGYDAYLTKFPAKPQYRRVVYYAHAGCPIFRWLSDHGVDVKTERLGTKILCDVDGWARTYDMNDGGVAEVREEPYNPGEYVIVFIDRSDAEAYRHYYAPLPFWAYSMG